MTLNELREVWNTGLTVTVYTYDKDGDYLNLYENDCLEDMSDDYDDYNVEGIYHTMNGDVIEIHISK